jgi:hypothetical protein
MGDYLFWFLSKSERLKQWKRVLEGHKEIIGPKAKLT